MNLKYHSQFLLDKEKDKSDARTRYRIKWGGNIVAFNLGYRIEVEKWSYETQRCKTNTTHGKRKFLQVLSIENYNYLNRPVKILLSILKFRK
jgi:putative uncharacterized protein (fragment)